MVLDETLGNKLKFQCMVNKYLEYLDIDTELDFVRWPLSNPQKGQNPSAQNGTFAFQLGHRCPKTKFFLEYIMTITFHSYY